ncbi:MAG: shikimate dehydrogenase [Tissierellia bacterium]|nr:shikimate dehydrogenase [Tissierellia bacterium]
MSIDSSTTLYCLIGNPIDKSLSPLIHNEMFRIFGKNSIYLAFNIEENKLRDVIDGFKAINVKGFNVTIPFKKTIIRYLDGLSPEAEILGAVNTVKNQDGKLIGYNTDGEGFYKTLRNNDIDVKDKNILLLGAGGAAYGIGITLSTKGIKSIYIANRTREKAVNLEKEIKKINPNISTSIGDLSLREINKKDIDIIINATSIGMYPLENLSPIELNGFDKKTIVYDIVYKPRETKLIKEANLRGFKAINGLSMLLEQAILSQKVWFNLDEKFLEKAKKVEGLLSVYVE